MTNSNAKGGFFGKALAAACSLALVASLTPAAAVSAFAAQTPESLDYLKITVKQLGSDGTTIIDRATTTLHYGDAILTSSSSASVVYKTGNNYGVATITSSSAATVSQLLRAATTDKGDDMLLGYTDDEVYKKNPTVTIKSGIEENSGLEGVISEFTQDQTFAWQDLVNGRNFYPDTTTNEIAWNNPELNAGAYIVDNQKVAMQSIGNGNYDNTAKEVATTNLNNKKEAPELGFTFITGITQNQAVNHNDVATTKMVQGVQEIEVTFPWPGLQNTERIAGTNWDDTMVKTLDKAYPGHSGQVFVVATAGGYEDALAASGFAGLLNCPLLMTDRNELTANTKEWIEEHSVASQGVTIYLIGGNMAVSDEVQASLEAIKGVADTANGSVVRIAGENSWDTALELYKFGKQENYVGKQSGAKWSDAPVIATSIDFQDALSISPYTKAAKAPVILTTDKGVLSDAVAAELQKDIQATSKLIKGATIVGGTVVVSPVVNNQMLNIPIQRYAGTTAYDTSNAIAKALYTGKVANGTAFSNKTEASMATGELYLDALASCNYTGKSNEVLLLVNDTAENGDVCITDFLTKYGPNGTPRPGDLKKAMIFGGTTVVSEAVQLQADNALNASL